MPRASPAPVQISWRLIDDPIAETEAEEFKDPEVRRNTKCVIWLSYTSNMISCGVREIICYLVQHKMVIRTPPAHRQPLGFFLG